MFCCGESLDTFCAEQDAKNVKQGVASDVAGTPNLVKTQGNALMAAPPQHEHRDGAPEEIVCVTIPEGVVPGQTLTVRSPDGFRSVSAVVPSGMQPGQSFMVRFPAVEPPQVVAQSVYEPVHAPVHAPSFAEVIDGCLAPTPDVDSVQHISNQRSAVHEANVQGEVEKQKEEVAETREDSDEPPEAPVHSPSFLERLEALILPSPDKPVPPTEQKSSAPVLSQVGTKDTVKEKSSIEANSVDEAESKDAPMESREVEPNPSIEPRSTTTAVNSLAHKGTTSPVPSEVRTRTISPVSDAAPRNTASGTIPNEISTSMGSPMAKETDQPLQSTLSPSPSFGTVTIVDSKQRYLLVHVPRGIPPGTTIHVEVPGENRTLAAVVPPDARSFHVAYTPRPTIPQRIPPPTQAPATVVPRHYAPPGQKLLLVRVPPGTAPGTTVHVSVPDEPGRLLAAQVPPGNVREFHVSYEPREHKTTNRSMLPPANPYTSSYYPPPQLPYYHPQPHEGQRQARGYQQPQPEQKQQQQQAPREVGSSYLPFVGAAALGAAGLAAYEHYARGDAGGDDGQVDEGIVDMDGGDDDTGGGDDGWF